MRQSFRLQGGQKPSYQITQHRLGSVWSRGPDGWSGISAASDKWLRALRTVYRCKSYQDHSHRSKSGYKKICKPCCEHELLSIYWTISIDLFGLHPSIFQWQQAHASDRHTDIQHVNITASSQLSFDGYHFDWHIRPMYSAMFMAGTSTHPYNIQPDLKRP